MSESTPAPEADGKPVANQELDELRSTLESIGELPIDQRPAILETANAALVAALAQLEEV